MKHLYKLIIRLIMALAVPVAGFAQNNSVAITDTTACENFTWHDSVYTESGEYFYFSDDSTVVDTLLLTVYHDTVTSWNHTACNAYQWNDSDYHSTGVYTQHFNTVHGCDSIVTLHLTVFYGTHNVLDTAVCESFIWHEIIRTQSGTYTYEYNNADGCASADTLHLTIYQPTTGDTTAVACGSFSWRGYDNLTESGDYTDTLTNAAGCDSIVILHLTINHSTTGDTTAVECESFTWHDSTYTETPSTAPMYTIEGGNHNGCDSVVILHLTIYHGSHTTYNASACGSYQWHDEIYDSTGTYIHTYPNADGCENVDTLHLTINKPIHFAVSDTVCGAYTWETGNGQTYTTSGTYLYPHLDGNDCMQVDTLNLTILSPVYSAITVDTCESYVWDNTTYTTSGDFVKTYTANNGCDSVVTLHLTIHNPVHTAVTVTECSSYTWIANAETYTTSGDYTYSHMDANGCTQVDTLHLTILNTQGIATMESACESYTWTSGTGATYTTSGVYTYNHANANGCMQVDTLNLTILSPVYSVFTVDTCESYVWDNTTYTTSGDYIKTFTANSGCDSIVTLHLTIHNPVHTAITVAECGSYTWIANGETYTTSGDYTYSHMDANGCTQVDTLHLTIHPSSLEKLSILAKNHADGTPYMLIYPQSELIYQWYQDGAVIDGETHQYYVPSGILTDDICYAVRVAPMEPGACGVLTDCWVNTSSPNAKVRILPNPNNGCFKVMLPSDATSVQIFNANGQLVFERESIWENEMEINTNLVNGFYIVKVLRENGEINTEILVINR